MKAAINNKYVNVLVSIILFCIGYLVVYSIANQIIMKIDYVFKGWIINLSNFVVALALILISLLTSFYFSHSKEKQNNSLIRVVSSMFSIMSLSAIGIIIFIYMFLVIFMDGFFIHENEIVIDDEVLIARVQSVGFHHTDVQFFLERGIFILEKANKPIERLDGSFNYYDSKR
ncbi:hypothetical protein [Fusibacter sp. JL216-2]|uniref:hypothetical protein n=1 Tax=Fusibacter sp. JL216-2 TaxID=3071453 RepID=UPI003D3407D3